MTEQMIEVPLALTEQQRTDVLRFHETCEDDQGYDVPKARMKALARVGLVRSLGFGRYEFTDAGLALVEAVQVAANDDDDVQALRKKLEHGTGLCQLNVLWKDGRSAADATIDQAQYSQLLKIIAPAVAGVSSAFHAAVTGAVPAGLRLVPTEPTAEMFRAVSDGANDQALADKRSKHVWDSMLGAAPAVGFATEPFAVIGDYAACGGGKAVFDQDLAEKITDRMCKKTPVYTLETVAAAMAAIRTLEAKGYTYNGAELWKPPVGAAPDFNLIDDLRTRADDVDRLVRELDVLLNGEAGAAAQASLCDIVAQVRMYREEPGTGSLQLLALVADQVVGRVYHTPQTATVELNSCGRALADGAPLYSRPADALTRYVRAPSRKDPKYHEEWPEIDGGPVFDGVTYCNDLFAALKRYNVIVAETMPEGAADE